MAETEVRVEAEEDVGKLVMEMYKKMKYWKRQGMDLRLPMVLSRCVLFRGRAYCA